jgi:hypothetical protein
MIYRGTVRDNVVTLEAGAQLPDGRTFLLRSKLFGSRKLSAEMGPVEAGEARSLF